MQHINTLKSLLMLLCSSNYSRSFYLYSCGCVLLPEGRCLKDALTQSSKQSSFGPRRTGSGLLTFHSCSALNTSTLGQNVLKNEGQFVVSYSTRDQCCSLHLAVIGMSPMSNVMSSKIQPGEHQKLKCSTVTQQ